MSLIIPCRNEEGNISKLLEEAKMRISFPYQIVFVDDRSSDSTNKNMILEEKFDQAVKIDYSSLFSKYVIRYATKLAETMLHPALSFCGAKKHFETQQDLRTKLGC